jgi:hypothetical protein
MLASVKGLALSVIRILLEGYTYMYTVCKKSIKIRKANTKLEQNHRENPRWDCEKKYIWRLGYCIRHKESRAASLPRKAEEKKK